MFTYCVSDPLQSLGRERKITVPISRLILIVFISSAYSNNQRVMSLLIVFSAVCNMMLSLNAQRFDAVKDFIIS